MEQIVITNSYQDYSFIDITWLPVPIEVTSLNLYVKTSAMTSFSTPISLSRSAVNYRYTIPETDRGERLDIAISAYNSSTGEESGLSIVSFDTIPNPPSNVRFIYSQDNKVEMAWDNPMNRTNIKGYVIERRLASDPDYIRIDIASSNHYIDIGSDFSPPMSLNTYFYRICSISYANVLGGWSERSIAVKKDITIDINTMDKKVITLPRRSMKFRVKAVGPGGETSWVVRQGILCDSQRKPLHEMNIRITTKTEVGAPSLPVKFQSILSGIVFNVAEPQIFRLRAVDVSGAQSNAIETTAQNIILRLPFVVNSSDDDLISRDDRSLINRSVW